MFIIVILVLLVLSLLVFEAIMIRRSVSKIPVRIHVNGTRGKSSVTKYIHAGLKGENAKSMAKVTGEIPTLLKTDTSERIKRRSAPRVQEQFKIIQNAAIEKTDVLALECMSIDPRLQNLESRFYRPSIYIITNIRDDHREISGGSEEEQVLNFCRSIPSGSQVLLGDKRFKYLVQEWASAKGATFIETLKLNEEERAQLPESTVINNVELALTACMQAGFQQASVFNSMAQFIRQEDSLHPAIFNFSPDRYFLNAFTVNDTKSLNVFLKIWRKRITIDSKISFVFNTRNDRPLRTGMFCNWLMEHQSELAVVILLGTHAQSAKRMLSPIKKNVQVALLKQVDKNEILKISGDANLIVGIGNIKGEGYAIIKAFTGKHDN